MADIPVKEIGEMLDEVSEKIPKLINGLMSSLYSAENGKNMGQAIAAFYKELIENGFPQEEALKLAKDYMISLKDTASNFTK